MSDTATTPTAPNSTRKRRLGRSGIVRRIAGINLRSAEGRAYTRAFNELVALYGEDDLPRIKELALLRVQIERTHADALNPDTWVSLRARDALSPLVNTSRRLEAALRAAKVAQEAENVKPAPTLADFISSRSTAFPDDGEG